MIASALAAIAFANLAVIVRLWLHAGGISAVRSAADALTSAGRLTALIGAYLALVAVLLLARVPVLEDLVGFGRLTAWHRRAARACLALLLAHATLTTAGLALGDDVTLPREVARLITQYPGVITAVAALVLLVAVGVTSMTFLTPGIRSRLDRKSGTQNAWLTSSLTRRSCTGLPTGMTISGPRPGSPVMVTSSSG